MWWRRENRVNDHVFGLFCSVGKIRCSLLWTESVKRRDAHQTQKTTYLRTTGTEWSWVGTLIPPTLAAMEKRICQIK